MTETSADSGNVTAAATNMAAAASAAPSAANPATVSVAAPSAVTAGAVGAQFTPRLVTVQGVNWGNVLDLVHLFRGFRLAINPAKLALALLAIVLIYVGGRLFDVAWGPQVYADEMERFATERPEVYAGLRGQRMQSRQESLEQLLGNLNVPAARRAELKGDPAGAYGELKAGYKKKFEEEVAATDRLPAEAMQKARADAAARLMGAMRGLNDIYGKGIFETFLKYETDQFDRLVDNTLTFVRVTPVRGGAVGTDLGAGAGVGGVGVEGQAVSGGLMSRDPDRLWRSDTVLGCIANMTITGPSWLFTGTAPMQLTPAAQPETWGAWMGRMSTRALYLASLILLAVFSLLMLALAGASISRLSALELAGIERAPLKDVALFAVKRLWVFIKAPVSPFLILLVIGLAMAVVAMLGAVPYVGPVLIGLVFFAFLGVSFVLMLLLLGILGGFNLLYPTIAVEGADSFDAMSRSFAYVYARPWRLLFYTVTSLIYGVVTFLFVSFGVYLILMLTHTFVGWGMGLFGTHYGAYSGSPALETIWPMPQFAHPVTPVNWWAMSWPECIGSALLHIWVYLLLTGIGAYVISYYFSSHTIMYLLLRRSVDGQNLREVYLEEK